MKVLNDLLSKDEALGRSDHGVLNDRKEVPSTAGDKLERSGGKLWKRSC